MRTTYGFKNAGRKRNADPSRKGDLLMPGLYKHGTSVDQLNKHQVTYSFKACDRYHTPTALVGYIDKVLFFFFNTWHCVTVWVELIIFNNWITS